MEAEKIKKALECCEKNTFSKCTECPMGKAHQFCSQELCKKALALITEQEQRIESLERRLRYLLQSKTISDYDEVDIHTKEYVKDIHSLDANIEHLNEKNERLLARNLDLSEKGEKVVIAYKKLSEENERLIAKGEWISVEERLPETDNENQYTFNVLVYIPKRDGCRQHGIYIGKIRRVKASDGKDNFWNIPIQECEWTVWGWSYFEHPVVTHWMPLPEAPKMKGGADQKA